MTKIETIDTCPKSKLSLKGTNGPLEVKTQMKLDSIVRNEIHTNQLQVTWWDIMHA